MDDKKTKRVTIYLTKAEKEKLEKAAQKKGLDISALVRMFIYAEFEKEKEDAAET
jgi:post-segregation antitoxin (ccd killing protein)